MFYKKSTQKNKNKISKHIQVYKLFCLFIFSLCNMIFLFLINLNYLCPANSRRKMVTQSAVFRLQPVSNDNPANRRVRTFYTYKRRTTDIYTFLYLTSLVPSVHRTVINGSRRCVLYPIPLSVLHFTGT